VVSRRHDQRGVAPFPRSLRVNQVLREVVAEEIERLADADERLRLVTVTDVDTAPDLRHATVYLSSLTEESAAALEGRRVQLQRTVAREIRLKRTPQLGFEVDPAVVAGDRVDEALRRIHEHEHGGDVAPGEDSEGGPAER
jgi:ribosome-binding factor A